MNGIEREVDNLGRVVIPIEYRKKLGIKANKKVLVSLNGNAIVLVPVDYYCALCGQNITKDRGIRLCDCCINRIKSEE